MTSVLNRNTIQVRKKSEAQMNTQKKKMRKKHTIAMATNNSYIPDLEM